MRILKKTVCLLLCLMLVMMSASACKTVKGQDEQTSGETNRTDDATVPSGEPTTNPPDPITPTEDVFPISALKETKIVYRTGASEAVTGYAISLRKQLRAFSASNLLSETIICARGATPSANMITKFFLAKPIGMPVQNCLHLYGNGISDIQSTAIKFWYGAETSRRLKRQCRILPMKL